MYETVNNRNNFYCIAKYASFNYFVYFGFIKLNYIQTFLKQYFTYKNIFNVKFKLSF